MSASLHAEPPARFPEPPPTQHLFQSGDGLRIVWGPAAGSGHGQEPGEEWVVRAGVNVVFADSGVLAEMAAAGPQDYVLSTL